VGEDWVGGWFAAKAGVPCGARDTSGGRKGSRESAKAAEWVSQGKETRGCGTSRERARISRASKATAHQNLMISSLRPLLERLYFQLDAWGSPIAQLATRVVFGQAFALTGWGKLTNLDKIVAFFTDLGIPFPGLQAPMVATIEFVGGILLVLGLGTRITSMLLLSTMVVALATADRASLLQGFVLGESFADVTSLPYLVALLWLIAKGAGKVSVDRVLANRVTLGPEAF
jgi:putative oxidoreductase